MCQECPAQTAPSGLKLRHQPNRISRKFRLRFQGKQSQCYASPQRSPINAEIKKESRIGASKLPDNLAHLCSGGSFISALLHAGANLRGSLRSLLLAGVLLLFLVASRGLCQTVCPGSESCPGSVAQLLCPTPGTTLPGNDVTFTWCNANADYFLDIESIPGAHDIFYALVSFQNFVRLINLPTNGATIYVTLWTQVHGQWQTPIQYTYAAAHPPPGLTAAMLGPGGHFQFIIEGVTPGRTNVVEVSPDLFNWSPMGTNVAVGNSMLFLDPTPTIGERRFYRTFEIR
jgi:hypothetical protein